jgi:hypothetical protein
MTEARAVLAPGLDAVRAGLVSVLGLLAVASVSLGALGIGLALHVVVCCVMIATVRGMLFRFYAVAHGALYLMSRTLNELDFVAAGDHFGAFSERHVALFDLLSVTALLIVYLSYLIATGLGPSKNWHSFWTKVGKRTSDMFVVVSAALSAMVMAIIAGYYVVSGAAESTVNRADIYASHSLVFASLSYALWALLPAVVVTAVARQTLGVMRSVALVIGLAAPAVAYYVVSGTRSHLIAVFVTLGIAFVASSPKTASWGTRALAAVVMGGAVLVTLALRFVRGLSEAGIEFEPESALEWAKEWGWLALTSGDLGYANVVIRFVAAREEFSGYPIAGTLVRFILAAAPKEWVDIKPDDVQRLYGTYLFPDLPGMTVPPGVLGDALANYGDLWFVAFIIYGVALGLGDRSTSPTMTLALPSLMIPMYHLVRGAVPNALIIMLWLVCVSWVYARVLGLTDGPHGCTTRAPDEGSIR